VKRNGRGEPAVPEFFSVTHFRFAAESYL